MSIYVQRRCWNCKEILHGYTHDYRAIGVPFVQCESCLTYNRYDHINEWDLKNTFEKLRYIGVVIWTTILYAMIGPIIALGAAQLFGWDKSNRLFLYSYSAGLLIMTIVSTGLFLADLRTSRERLRDQHYIDTLCKLKLIRRRDS